ncbi:flagellar hook-associated protein 3 [Candidimonas sp. SYP-B2681]|uniref:flagellar hook-associated protein FlgL n=1 Tax=Candidimonas sp. SYP-B2681 TaxID=2497686 RepID=UPI000F8915D3|nr:flagellar hook-associated protein FlgL [Candidimonas sp. SYP-B2681]RTZ47550.1 flagellar hook-associated protein 3 [Candidimonas sp. SYP-B2681]
MRISSNLFFQTGLNSINAQQSDLMHLYQQIGSGQRMVTPADDPLAAAQAINISQSQTLNARFAANREVLKNNLGVEENTLNSVTALLQDVKTQLIAVGNGTLSDEDRATLGNVLVHARTSLLGLANATDGSGQYMFSGAKGDTEPFSLNTTSGKIDYVGDGGQRKIQADQTRQISGSDVGSDIFNRAAPGTSGYLTRAVGNTGAANTGTGQISTPTITNPKGTNIGNTFTIRFLDNVQYQVDVTTPSGVAVGAPITGLLSATTTSIDLPGGVQVKFSGVPKALDTFVVEPAASAATDLNIFDTLDSIISSLATSLSDPVASAAFQNTLTSAMQRLDVNYDNVLTVRASVGARLNEIDALHANGSLRSLSYSNQLSKLEDVDYYSATTQLQLRTTALEAASLAFKKIQSIGLFNQR